MQNRKHSPWQRAWTPFAVAAILVWASMGSATGIALWLPTALRGAAVAFVVLGLVVVWQSRTDS